MILLIFLFILAVVKGNLNHLMKASSKRRRGKAEIKEQKRAEAQQQSEIVRKLARIEELEQSVKQYNSHDFFMV